MAKSPDDIYKEDKIPLFARKGYRRKHQRHESRSKTAHKEVEQSNHRASLYGQRERRQSIHEDEFILLQGADPNKRKNRRSRSRTKARLIRQVSIVLGSIAIIYAIILMAILGARIHSSRKAHATKEKKVLVQKEELQQKQDTQVALQANSRLDALSQKIQKLKRSQKALTTVTAPGRGLSEQDKSNQLNQALKETPQFMAVKLTMADQYIEGREYEQAVDLLIQSLDMDPANMEARNKLGKMLIKTKDYLAAERIGHWMLEDFPYSLEGHSILAGAYLHMDNLQLAIRHLHKIVEYDSQNIIAQNNLGVAYSRMKNYPQAIKIFENILKMDEVNTISYYNLAFCYAQTKNPARAAEVIELAGTHFGYAFVMSWLDRPDFESVRTSKEFQSLMARIEELAVADSTLQLNSITPPAQKIAPNLKTDSPVVPSKKGRPSMLEALRSTQ